jgi:tRNA-specific 2-thiouridylase
VVGKDLQRNVLIAAQGHDNPLLMHDRLWAEQLHWIAGHAPAFPLTCEARIRHRQPLQRCVIRDAGPNRCEVRFTQAQRAITPGQSVVFYQQANCLGGGIITAADR